MRSNANYHKFLILSAFLAVTIFVGCDDDGTGPGNAQQITGTLVAHSDCGGFDFGTDASGDITSSQSAVAWEWDGHGTLNLRHINAAFNCCPEISCEFAIDQNVITVVEHDEGDCDCLCLFDADFQITGLTIGIYTIKFEEKYLYETDPKIEFSISLGNSPASDTVSVTREHYPWMPETPSSGIVTDFSDCGGFVPERTYGDIPDDSICVSWEYDDSHNLLLTHHNMVLNCGMYDITARITVDTGGILIEERPMINPMFCWCEFDIDMVIPNLPPDLYMVVLTTSRWDGEEWIPGMDTAYFPINPGDEPDGYHCYSPVPIVF